MTKRITMLSPIQGGIAYGLLTVAGSPYTVDDALAADLVNRNVAFFTDPPVPTSVYATFATYMTAAQFAQLTMGAAGVTYEITDVGGRPQYRWNGSAFVSIGSGGGGGGAVPTPIPATALIPLNTYTELSPLSIAADTLFVPNSATAAQGGSANLSVVITDASKRITFDARFQQVGNTALDYTLNRVMDFSFTKTGLSYLWDVVVGRIIDNTPPTYGALVIENGSRSRIKVTMSEALGPWLGTLASITLTGAGGRTATAVTISGSDVLVDCSGAAFTYSDTPSIAIAAGAVEDIAGNVAAALASSAVTNQIQRPLRTANFTQANSAVTMNPVSDGGSGFVILRGSAFGIAGNKGYCTSATVDSIAVLDTGNVDSSQFLELTMPNDEYPATIFRASDNANFLQLVALVATGRASLNKVVGGVSTPVVGATDCGYAIGDTVKFKPVTVGDSVQIWIAKNGGAFARVPALDYTITDAALRTGTLFGVNATGNGNNFRIVSVG